MSSHLPFKGWKDQSEIQWIQKVLEYKVIDLGINRSSASQPKETSGFRKLLQREVGLTKQSWQSYRWNQDQQRILKQKIQSVKTST